VVRDSFTVDAVTLMLSLSHDRMSDLSVVLQAPNGRQVQLLYRRSVNPFANVTFSDAGTALPTTGSFSPTVRGEQSLSALTGGSSAGTWTLLIHNLGMSGAGAVGPITLGLLPRVGSTAAEKLTAQTTPILTPR
jgi:subtilisin-like proprotein convertase family protein